MHLVCSTLQMRVLSMQKMLLEFGCIPLARLDVLQKGEGELI